jgi:hypothetical protein
VKLEGVPPFFGIVPVGLLLVVQLARLTTAIYLTQFVELRKAYSERDDARTRVRAEKPTLGLRTPPTKWYVSTRRPDAFGFPPSGEIAVLHVYGEFEAVVAGGANGRAISVISWSIPNLPQGWKEIRPKLSREPIATKPTEWITYTPNVTLVTDATSVDLILRVLQSEQADLSLVASYLVGDPSTAPLTTSLPRSRQAIIDAVREWGRRQEKLQSRRG